MYKSKFFVGIILVGLIWCSGCGGRCRLEDVVGRYYARGREGIEYVEIRADGKYVHYYRKGDSVIVDTCEYRWAYWNCDVYLYEWQWYDNPEAHKEELEMYGGTLREIGSGRSYTPFLFHGCWFEDMLTLSYDACRGPWAFYKEKK